jgi:hypothetical protein
MEDGTTHPYGPSLDRIDSTNPEYIFTREYQNCQLVPWVINCLRNNFDDDYKCASVVYPWFSGYFITNIIRKIKFSPKIKYTFTK